MAERVLLLHGLMMRRPAMLPLAWRLRARGFEPLLFTYSTLWREPEAAIQSLAARLRSLEGAPVHLLGHSLGGVIALETLRRFPDLPVARVLCLGSPIAGSGAARGLKAKGLGFVSGGSGGLLRAGVSALPEGHEIGMIAGDKAMGMGRLFGQFEGPNDGTVAVAETQLVGLAAHTVIHASHSGLIASRQAAGLSAQFLDTGGFEPA